MEPFLFNWLLGRISRLFDALVRLFFDSWRGIINLIKNFSVSFIVFVALNGLIHIQFHTEQRVIGTWIRILILFILLQEFWRLSLPLILIGL